MTSKPMPARALALTFIAWPFVAVMVLALSLVVCIGIWLAIPFLNRISALLQPDAISPRQFYE